jgi:glucose/mannose transport system permease protein
VAIFVYGFIAITAYTSLSNWSSMAVDLSYRGLSVYTQLFQHFRFQADIRNLLVFTIFFLAGCVSLGLLLAILVDQHIKGETFFRNIFLFPMALSFIVTGVVWRWIFTPTAGINQLLRELGLGSLAWGWATEPRVVPGWPVLSIRFGVPLAIFPLVIAAVWQLSGFAMAMFLAGLRAIPEEIREAARVEGASEVQIYRHVLIPILRPVFVSLLFVLGHTSLKIFDLVYAMTGSGPAFATDMPSMFMFDTTFTANQFNRGAAIAMMMLIMVATVVIPYLRLSLRGED